MADHTALVFEPLSAVFSGVADLRKVFAEAKARRVAGRGTLLFIDEIHRIAIRRDAKVLQANRPMRGRRPTPHRRSR